MSTLSRPESRLRLLGLPLNNGDRMKQPEFHRRYLKCPDDVKFELVGGIVYMASPLRLPHGTYRLKLGAALECYVSATPGVEAGDNATAILGEESEPQPDLTLRIKTVYGGQSRVNEEKYLEGPPELLAEIAHSTRALDMHGKRDDYLTAGVIEYIVLCVEEQEVHWFHFPSRGRIRPGPDGIAKSKAFPGLWLDVPALLAEDSVRMRQAMELGIASKPRAAFVKRLDNARRKKTSSQSRPEDLQ